jgi:lysophospholipase L1-like esterase
MNKKWKTVLIVSLIGNAFIIYVGIKALEYRAHINEYLDRYTYVVDELGQRGAYAEENVPLKSDSLVSGRVVFVGTQVTTNWDLDRYFPGYEVINRGVSPQKVSGFLLRFRPDVMELGPEAVVIEVSSYNFRSYNNVKAIEDYVACMVELAAVHGIQPLPATIIPPCRDSVDLDDYSIMDSILVYNNWLKEYCMRSGFDLVDFNQALSDDDGFLRVELAASPIDPNEKGYQLMTDVVIEALENISRFRTK